MKHNCLAVLTDSLHWKKFLNEKFSKKNLNKKILIADKNNLKFENIYYRDDAIRCNSPKFFEKYLFLDNQILENYSKYMPNYLNMQDRWFMNINVKFHDRKKMFFEHLRIFLEIFDYYKINLVLFASNSHRLFDYIIEIICIEKKIKLLKIHSHFPDACYISNSFENIDFKIKNKNKISAKLIEKISENPDTMHKYNSQLSNVTLATKKNENIIKTSFIYQSLAFIYHLLINFFSNKINKQCLSMKDNKIEFLKISKFYLYYYKNYLESKLSQKYYINKSIRNIKKKKYIYFPLNFEPEATTNPIAKNFHEAYLIAQNLNYLAPKNWNIVCKEHPRSMIKIVDYNFPRKISFYKRLEFFCKKIKFVNHNTTGLDIIKNSSSIGLASGSSATQSLACNIPVISYGDSYYNKCKSVLDGKSLIKKNFLTKIKKNNHKINFRNFLSNLYANSHDFAALIKYYSLLRTTKISEKKIVSRSDFLISYKKFYKSIKKKIISKE